MCHANEKFEFAQLHCSSVSIGCVLSFQMGKNKLSIQFVSMWSFQISTMLNADPHASQKYGLSPCGF